MSGRWAQSATEHETFARDGQGDALRRVLRRHGPSLLGLLALPGAESRRPAAVFTGIVATHLARRWRGSVEQWFPHLLRAIIDTLPPDTSGETGNRALFLASRDGLSLDELATVFRRTPEAMVDAMSAAALQAAGVTASPPVEAFHLPPATLAGFCAGVLPESALNRATAHVAFCETCRSRALTLGGLLSEAYGAPLPDLDPELLEATVAEAREQRMRHARWPRLLRFCGLKPGARFRPVRVGVVAMLVFLGLLSAVTQIHHSIARQRKVTSTVTIHATERLLAGGTTAVSVLVATLDDKDPAPRQSVEVTARLLGTAGRELARASAKTDGAGLATLSLGIEELAGMRESAILVAEANVGGESRRAELNVEVVRELRQHLSVDKPTYQPGQTIHLRGLSLDAGSGKPLAGRPAHLVLRDPRGNRIADTVTAVSPMGVTTADVELSAGAALGNYTGSLSVEGGDTTVSLKVEKYTLPPFAVVVTPKVASTDGKKPFPVEVEAKFTTGVPMARGMARLTVMADGSEIFAEAVAIKDGLAKFEVSVPSWLADARWRAPTTLVLHAAVRDPAGRAEAGHGGLELIGDAMAITVVSEASSVRRNLPRANHILVRALRPDETPVQTKVELFSPGDGDLETVGGGERLGEAQTGADGLATLDLPPAFFGRPLGVLAKDPKDGKQYWTTIQAPPMREGALVLGCERSLLRAGETLACEVFVPSPRARLLRVERSGQLVALATTPATQGLAKVNITVPPTAPGLLRVTMEDAPTEDAVYLLAGPHDGLRVELSGLEPKQPGEEAALRMRVTDGAGKPRAAYVGLAVVDAAVFARSAGQAPRQIIQKLFSHPDIAPAGMALMFPEPLAESAPPGESSGWTPGQQATARWLLATTQTAAANLRRESSESRDRIALSIAEGAADARARTVRGITVITFGAALLLTLLVVSFWFRTAFGGMCAALVVGLLLRVVLTRGLDMRENTVDPVALLVALTFFAGLMFAAARQRGADLRGVAVVRPRLTLRLVLAGAPIVLIGLALVFSSSMMLRSGGDFGYRDQATAAWPASPSPQTYAKEEESGGRAESAPSPSVLAAAAPASAAPVAAPQAMRPPSRKAGGAGRGDDDFGRVNESAEKSKSSTRSRPGSSGGADANAASVTTRQDFPETLYFNAAAVVGEDGTGEVRFRIADSITTWEAHALASDVRGVLGAGTGKLVVNKPFHVDVDVPMDLTTGDDVTLQIAVQNETDTSGTARVTASADSGLSLDSAPLAEAIGLAAHGLAGRFVPLKATGAGQQFVTVSGAMGADRDALKRSIQVSPKGREVRTTAAGLVIDQVRRTIDLPADAFVEGRSIMLTLLGSPLAAALDGLDLLAAEPHGSFEQQASAIFANALILQALRATGRIIPAQESLLLRYLRLSYQDLLGYEASGGGFSPFGRTADLTPTAWGLLVLTEISKHTYVDEDILTRTRNILAGQQSNDGSFQGPTETAYVALAMLSSDPECLATEDPVKPWTPGQRTARAACRKVVQRLEDAFTIIEGVDSYTLAWAADALVVASASAGNPANTRRSRADAILDELDRRAAIVGAGRDRRVTFRPRGATLYGARGVSAEVETTAVVAHALTVHGGRGDKAREAMRSLLVLRDPGGGFYSSQGTALALRAILAAALSGQAGGRATVELDGSAVTTVEFDPTNVNEPRRVDLTDKVRPGAVLVVKLDGWEGATDLAYRLTTHHFEPWTRPPGPPVAVSDGSGQAADELARLGMTQRLDAKSYGLGDQAMLSVDIFRYGGRAVNGLLIAQVGLPPGFRLAERALDPGAIGSTLRIEPAARGLTLYLDDPTYGSASLSIPLVAARAVRSVVVPRSRVYFGYQPQIEAQAPPVPVYVRQLLGKRTGG